MTDERQAGLCPIGYCTAIEECPHRAMTDERQAGLRDRRLAAATSQLRTVAAFAHRTDQSHKQSFEDCNRRRCVKAKEVLEYASRPLAAHPAEAEEKPDAV